MQGCGSRVISVSHRVDKTTDRVRVSVEVGKIMWMDNG